MCWSRSTLPSIFSCLTYWLLCITLEPHSSFFLLLFFLFLPSLVFAHASPCELEPERKKFVERGNISSLVTNDRHMQGPFDTLIPNRPLY
ncbi:hypothetical protein F5X96DRAFT_660415 [Biscogniauxia mediterranea]|nr:hypothetical protein F5X96DRAFT_660415 [Biscogniauxia mediterranea]